MQWQLRYTVPPLAAKSLNDMFIARNVDIHFRILVHSMQRVLIASDGIAVPQFHLPLTTFKCGVTKDSFHSDYIFK